MLKTRIYDNRVCLNMQGKLSLSMVLQDRLSMLYSLNTMNTRTLVNL